MSTVDALRTPGKWWAIEVTPGNRRVMAEVFPHPRGLVFADIGWDDPLNPRPPFHVVDGELQPDGAGFLIGNARITELDEDDPLAWEWLQWVNYLASREGRAATREAAEAALKLSGILEE